MDSVMDLTLESSRVDDAGVLGAAALVVAAAEAVLDRVVLVWAFAGFFVVDGGVEGEEEERLLADVVAFALAFFADPARLAAGACAFLAAIPFAPLGFSCWRLAVLGFAGFFVVDGGAEEEERLLADVVAFALAFFADPARLAAGACAFLAPAPFLAADFFLDDGDDFVVFLDDVTMMLSRQLR